MGKNLLKYHVYQKVHSVALGGFSENPPIGGDAPKISIHIGDLFVGAYKNSKTPLKSGQN